MSINSALLAGVSGLTANSAALAAISQNIANVNTVGYKRTAGEFQTIINSQSQGAGYAAGGSWPRRGTTPARLGSCSARRPNTDLGIAGQGFFVVTEKPENLQVTDSRLFTRAGAFTVDNLGYLKNTAGLYLQGWPVDAQGDIATDPSDLNRLRTINVGSVGGTAEATTRIQLNANIKSSQLVSAEATDAAAVPGRQRLQQHHQLDVHVGRGNRRRGEARLRTHRSRLRLQGRPADGRHLVPEEHGSEPVVCRDPRDPGLRRRHRRRPDQRPTEIGSDRLHPGWSSRYGRYMAAMGAAALFPDPANATLSFGASDSAAPAAGAFKWAPGLGIDNQALAFDLSASAGGLTQYDSASVVQAVLTNGTAFGNLSEVKIDDTGFVTAIFDNGVTRKIAQIALATFPSPDSLSQTSGNAYRVSQGPPAPTTSRPRALAAPA
jgi:flagellar hook protein FlgE